MLGTRPDTGAAGPHASGTFLASAFLTGVCAGQVPFGWLLGVLPKWVSGWVRIGRRTVVAKPTMSSVLVPTLVSPSAMPSPSSTSTSGWERKALRSPSLDSDALANTSVNVGRSAGVFQRIRNSVTAPLLPAQLTHPCRT